MSRNMKIATLFTKVMETGELDIFIPTRVLFGKEDEKGIRFYDVLSQTMFYDLDNYAGDEELYSGYYYSEDLKDVKSKFPNMSLYEFINQYLRLRKEQVYFYSLDDGDSKDYCLKSLPIDEFYEKYKIDVKYTYFPDNLKDIDFTRIELEQESQVEESQVEEVQKVDDVEETKLPDIVSLQKEIMKHVFFQDEQIKKMLIAIYRHIFFEDPSLKANIFVYGPTGVGKTEILRQISKNLGLPMVIEDANAYSVAGYVGKSADDALRHLYEAANGDLELAQRGILVFDEIDKKHKQGSGDTNVSSEGVLHSLLKIIEGGTFEVELDRYSSINFDTSNLIVIVSGAFEDLLKKEQKRVSIGFGNQDQTDKTMAKMSIVDKMVEYGMAREFMGRFNLLVELNSLSKENLKHILLHSELSVLKKYQQQFEELGVKITLSDELCNKICNLAYLRHTGARALNNIVHEIFENILYNLFSSEEFPKEIVLGEESLSEPGIEEKQNVLKKSIQAKNSMI